MTCEWQPIETAPKTNPDAEVAEKPIRILLRFGTEGVAIAYWDWYYAEGGHGCRDGFAWIEPHAGEPLNLHYSEEPDGWAPLPKPRGQIEERGTRDEVDAAGDAASLTQKLISTHRQLAVSSQDADTAKLHYDTIDEIARLQTDLASTERLAEFYQTELERILKEGTRR